MMKGHVVYMFSSSKPGVPLMLRLQFVSDLKIPQNKQKKPKTVCSTLYKEFHTFYLIFIMTLWNKASSITKPFLEFGKSISRRNKWLIQVICSIYKLTMTWTHIFNPKFHISFSLWRFGFSFMLNFYSGMFSCVWNSKLVDCLTMPSNMGWILSPQKSYVETLTPSTSECDSI